MSTLTTYLRRAHHFLNRQGVYPVWLSSALAVLLLVARIYVGHSRAFLYMPWNLFLGWVPLLSSLLAWRLDERYPGRWWLLIGPGVLWLLFYPNAPYLVTDFWHLTERPPIPIWYDIGMLSLFGLTGLFLAVLSLRVMQKLVAVYLGRLVSWAFVLVALVLSGLGVYLGRFLRWNSWDLILHPRAVLTDVAARLAHPQSHLQTYGVTLLFAAILLVCYLMLACRD
jgi:uncharacterized membrane protein